MNLNTTRENSEILESFFRQLHRQFGDDLAASIIQVMAVELGGSRLTFPSLGDLARRQRNQKIQAAFNGANLQELAVRFDLSTATIRRIVNQSLT